MTTQRKRLFDYICRMKRIFLIIVPVILLYACNENNNKKPAVTFTENFKSDTLHFSVNYPKNWEIIRSPDEKNSITIVEKITNENDVYQENIVCWSEEMPMALSDSIYFQASVTQLKISNPDLRIEKTGKIKLGENDFSSFTFDFTTNDSTQYEVQGFCLIKGNKGYNFSCTAVKTEMPGHLQTFKEILSTFKPL